MFELILIFIILCFEIKNIFEPGWATRLLKDDETDESKTTLIWMTVIPILLYFIYTFVWCLDPLQHIKIAGLIILGVAGVGSLYKLICKKEMPDFLIRIDSAICAIVLLFIGWVKIFNPILPQLW